MTLILGRSLAKLKFLENVKSNKSLKSLDNEYIQSIFDN